MFLNVNGSAEDVHINKVHDGGFIYVRQSEDTINRDPTSGEVFQGFRKFLNDLW